MKRSTIALGAASVVAVAALGYTGIQAYADPAPAADEPELALAEPGGEHPVGMTTLDLTDSGRADPWVPSERRELMVSLWYPADRPSDTAAPYATAEESELFTASQPGDLPADTLTTIKTNATVDAKPIGGRHEAPLVILSPGFSFPRATLTGLAEELASRGFVVAGIGHNYEALGTTFSDGHTTTCVACDANDPETVETTRAADASFVVDELTSHPKWRAARLIDADRIAMGGHSIGGASTFQAVQGDSRIDAGFNMDGTFHHAEGAALDKPFLMLGQNGNEDAHVPGGTDDSWDDTWSGLGDWKRWISVDDTTHSSFTDLAPFADVLGIPLQELPGDRCDEITRGYVAGFLDTVLRDADSPLMDGPVDEYPEVRFHNP